VTLKRRCLDVKTVKKHVAAMPLWCPVMVRKQSKQTINPAHAWVQKQCNESVECCSVFIFLLYQSSDGHLFMIHGESFYLKVTRQLKKKYIICFWSVPLLLSTQRIIMHSLNYSKL